MNSFLDRNIVTMNHSAEGHLMEDHLSDDQIDDHLIGDLAAAPAAHLAACTECTVRVAAAGLPIANFDSVTLAWSERRSATLPIPSLSTQKPVWQRHMGWVTASFALAIGFAFINVSHEINVGTASLQSAPQYYEPAATPASAQPRPALIQTASVAAAPAPAQISTDNQMLKAVDDELQSPSEDPSELGLEPAHASRARSLAAISVED
jgi:hypothetical protein